MSGSVDFRLGAIAASLRMDRSALAAELIDEGLRRYALDGVLRQFSDRQEAAGDSSPEARQTLPPREQPGLTGGSGSDGREPGARPNSSPALAAALRAGSGAGGSNP
jgi:hypothetical protein